jgi:serine protease
MFSFAAKVKPLNTSADKPIYVADEIIVSYDANVTKAKKDKLKDKYAMTFKKNSKKAGKFTVYKHKNPKAILAQLKNEPGVLLAEQNAYAYATAVPNDPYYSPYQWHMTRIGMETVWDLTTGSSSVIVAVIDTGIDQSMEDLAQTTFTSGYDFINNDNDPTDDEGHGTHVCGTIAQSTNNNLGTVGIVYNSTIMPVKVLGADGTGSYDAIADGIYYAVDNGAKVLNLSLGGYGSLSVLENAVNYAWNNGAIIMCAAGNDNTSQTHYPSAYTNAMGITATNYLDEKADYSNYGSYVDITAPGGDGNDNNGDGYMDGVLQNTFSGTNEGYYFMYGTSMATPHVAGIAAAMFSVNPSITNTEVRNILETTADDIGAAGWDQYFGHGLLDGAEAVQQAMGGSNVPPTADFTFAVNNYTVTFTDQSSDSDGTIVSWLWNFGDGNTSTAQNPVHTYATDGAYNVSLTVTDDGSATGNVSKNVVVGNLSMYVADIAMSIARLGASYQATAVITVLDQGNNPVDGATVYVDWSGCPNSSASAVTGADGTVTINSPAVKKCTGPYTVTVTNVSHGAYAYDSASNVETSDSISY